jgi:hypothetical protein
MGIDDNSHVLKSSGAAQPVATSSVAAGLDEQRALSVVSRSLDLMLAPDMKVFIERAL